MDLAEGHLAALNFLSKNFGWNIFNLGTGNCYSVLELINLFEKVTGVKVNYEFTAPRIGDIATSYATVHKAKTDLQWQARRNVESMCMSAWHWHKYVSKK
jgi:UDP-glucose 4-epimerase